jgi:23S rRNA (cytidine1920-2'-O)/16S rRNA (cytidine1409-2'-O)-methyltransferase
MRYHTEEFFSRDARSPQSTLLLSGEKAGMRGKPKRVRLDLVLLEQGLAASRERARALILAGKVLVAGRVVDKPGTLVAAGAGIALRAAEHPYVGRGGVKLQGALESLAISVAGRVCLDLGASTGGFTDCLLQRGAALVYAVDVGRGQLAASLRADPRVVVMERTHARTLTPADFPDRPEFATVDLSFISLAVILPILPPLLGGSGEILALIKPQFEVGRGRVGKGGVVRDPAQHRQVITRLGSLAVDLGLKILGVVPSCLLGPKGNREFFIYLSRACHFDRLSVQPEPSRSPALSQSNRVGPGLDPARAAELAVGACPEPSRRADPEPSGRARPEPSRREEG